MIHLREGGIPCAANETGGAEGGDQWTLVAGQAGGAVRRSRVERMPRDGEHVHHLPDPAGRLPSLASSISASVIPVLAALSCSIA